MLQMTLFIVLLDVADAKVHEIRARYWKKQQADGIINSKDLIGFILSNTRCLVVKLEIFKDGAKNEG